MPFDPLDGAGSDPPGDPDRGATWRSPTSLGNGLVHDSRYALEVREHSTTVTAATLAAGVEWGGFVPSHAEKVENGFRPTQVDAGVTLASKGLGFYELSIADRSVYLCDDDANYRTTTKTHVFMTHDQEQALIASGPSSPGQSRPTSIDTFSLSASRLGDSIVWTWDENPVPWQLIVGQDSATFAATVAELAGAGYRPISIASRQRNGESEYAAIFVDDGVDTADWELRIGYDAEGLAEQTEALWAEGFYPVRRTYEQGSEEDPRFNVLWMKRSPGLKLELRTNMDAAGFESEDIDWRQRGYHLESACAYANPGGTRHVGLWVQHDPYLRWDEGIAIDPQSQIYVDRYRPFHRAAIQAMTLEGDPREGEFFRPSATLHIFEGPKLVLNRAYTYAGAIYPDTPLDAKMGIASASKSITAAAVVREMAVQGIPLTTAFSQVAGIQGVPNMQNVPLVVDVLRNLGGFAVEAVSYSDHALIANASGGQYPVSGEMMYDYVVAGGHLKAGGKDSYWSAVTYINSQQKGKFIYSNLGFSMLGEAIRIQSNLSYEEYVRTYLLTPLSLHPEIYPDPGHRYAVNEPTQAGLRSYLINDAHPYNRKGCATGADCDYLACDADEQGCMSPACSINDTCTGCTTNNKSCPPGWVCDADECINPVTPLTGSEAVPEPAFGSDNSPTWSYNAGPPDPSVPESAAVYRYAGRVYMGGAPLAAGGWHADGESLGILIRVIAQTNFLMPQAVAAQLWTSQWWNPNHNKATNWYYGLGWYVRGNWVAMAGGADGSMSLVLHNRAYDFTVVYLTNLKGNAFGEFLNPLLDSPNLIWSTPGSPQSVLGEQFPCVDDFNTPQNECQGAFGAY